MLYLQQVRGSRESFVLGAGGTAKRSLIKARVPGGSGS